jgi:hypothetical protein
VTITNSVVSNDEAARLLGITPNTLKLWRCKGRGPKFIKFGETKQSGVGYEVADIEAWKAARKFASTTACSPAARPTVKPAVRR